MAFHFVWLRFRHITLHTIYLDCLSMFSKVIAIETIIYGMNKNNNIPELWLRLNRFSSLFLHVCRYQDNLKSIVCEEMKMVETNATRILLTSLLKSSFQFLQLGRCECCSNATLFSFFTQHRIVTRIHFVWKTGCVASCSVTQGKKIK